MRQILTRLDAYKSLFLYKLFSLFYRYADEPRAIFINAYEIKPRKWPKSKESN